MTILEALALVRRARKARDRALEKTESRLSTTMLSARKLGATLGEIGHEARMSEEGVRKRLARARGARTL